MPAKAERIDSAIADLLNFLLTSLSHNSNQTVLNADVFVTAAVTFRGLRATLRLTSSHRSTQVVQLNS